MLSCIFILNEHGEVMVELQFSERIPRTVLDGFWSTFMAPCKSSREPAAAIVSYGGTIFSHIHRGNVFLVGTCTSDDTALLVLEQLALVARVLTMYLTELSENTVRENFSVVYQLLQEMFDYGYPLTTELYALEELVPRPTLENRVCTILGTPMVHNVLPLRARTANIGVGSRQVAGAFGAVPWRDPETRHSTNEILFDVVETLDYILDSEGRCVKAAVRGSIEVNCRLSGMPDLVVRLRDVDAVVDDVALHRCVRLDRYDNDRTLCFIPPDGKFTLMRYTCKPSLLLPLPPFYVTPQVTFNSTGGRFHCMAGIRGGMGFAALAEKDTEIQRLTVRLLLPPSTSSLTVTNCSSGSTAFDRSKSTLTWTMGSLTQSATPSLGGEFLLEADTAATSSSPPEKEGAGAGKGASKTQRAGPSNSGGVANATIVAVSFQLPNRIVSNLRVDSVQIINETGRPYKGVKYLTQSGSYFIRGV
ncbi:putative adaptor complex subunit medium chain 3 [Leptomonas pyrrhocoris]|uniref:Putative adaptor complex subunit medium chain 3 n=1 Tax=Leptomonas pyrrhocoris TaxID=157538 RepID=A0A0N0DWY4_LEPPY|nr:putative adaptor complex subunit medium chain 3 [Leptomonas pyrrhocoris]XP_015660770.1 putative adaptor complex subunit medium chain 3 [Leptomonas pyrrhocoris]KPA82330.1 putative adaptor complex subunit medium chain 3 [Leptomonas pyrrhocoris]KPA82331.1 putative adaptor complex subunit medium chain 3 [Leptomonas pyrrhocoris]|eukprot:XP_015660769.1 putative adaptor complex subunit medium chain 3 [Leptomonas pyrrhocoris]